MNQSHKRKRGKPPQLLETTEQRAKKCLSKYHHAGIETTRAFKKALALELQKLKKRLKKALEVDQGATARLEAEIEAAKLLETDDVAKYYLAYTIQKSHAQLHEFLALPDSGSAPHRDADAATKNVVARLLGSKMIRESIKSCTAQMEVIAGIVQPPRNNTVKKSTKERSITEMKSRDESEELQFTSFPSNNHGLIEDDDDDNNDEEDDDDDDDDLSMRATSSKHHEIDKRHSSSAKAQASVAPVSTSTSTFLPSLQSGYLPAENSSDDEQELKGLFPAQKKERKNRRGQRARRKIAEAKHGSKANHIIKEREARQKEFEERVARREAREAARTGANAIAIEKAEQNRRERREAALRPIHSSWAIAKAQKEKLKTAKPQGTKIEFD